MPYASPMQAKAISQHNHHPWQTLSQQSACRYPFRTEPPAGSPRICGILPDIRPTNGFGRRHHSFKGSSLDPLYRESPTKSPRYPLIKGARSQTGIFYRAYRRIPSTVGGCGTIPPADSAPIRRLYYSASCHRLQDKSTNFVECRKKFPLCDSSTSLFLLPLIPWAIALIL